MPLGVKTAPRDRTTEQRGSGEQTVAEEISSSPLFHELPEAYAKADGRKALTAPPKAGKPGMTNEEGRKDPAPRQTRGGGRNG
jgi:hypothetical protein